MSTQLQVMALIVIVILSVTLTSGEDYDDAKINKISGPSTNAAILSQTAKTFKSPNLSFQPATLKIPETPPQKITTKNSPVRDWEVLDPAVNAQAVLIESLDDNFPLFYYQTYQPWPIASLTKLLTAVVVLEEIGANKKIEITPEAIAAEGNGADFGPGEIYTALDLIKIMLITSSNDAAVAFENYYGKEALVAKLNEKAAELQMLQTKIFDAAGLADENISTATDIAKLMKYILKRQPEILNWSRLPSLLVQPINKVDSHNLKNINPLADNKDFWGGKTGTSAAAKENLAAILSFQNQRILLILLGSQKRYEETAELLKWVGRAYQFN